MGSRALDRCFGQDDRELVSADAADDIGAAEVAVQRPRDRDERPIAGGMTVGVVHRLEVVDVDDDQAQRAPGPDRAVDLDRELFVERSMVETTREAVGIGERGEVPSEQRLVALQLGAVDGGRDRQHAHPADDGRDHEQVLTRERDVGVGRADHDQLRECRGRARGDRDRPVRERGVDHREENEVEQRTVEPAVEVGTPGQGPSRTERPNEREARAPWLTRDRAEGEEGAGTNDPAGDRNRDERGPVGSVR